MRSFRTSHEAPPQGPAPAARGKLESLKSLLGSLDRAAIAYSGGVDSAFLLAVAVEVLGERAVAFTAVSPSLPAGELAEARAVAGEIGAELIEIETHELDDERYRKNDPDRCYHCKSHLFARVIDEARQRGIHVVLDGSNRDDADDYRPGLEASRERGVRSPLKEVGLTKGEIRALAHRMDLEIWDKPASPCLASRIPYYSRVTERKLDQIERAERVLRSLGFPVVRVRHHGDVARVEVEADRLVDLVAPATRGRVESELRALGFAFVTVDLGGYRAGKLNRVLGPEAS